MYVLPFHTHFTFSFIFLSVTGSNFFGQLGDGTTVDHATVKAVDSGNSWAKTCPNRGAIAVSAGFATSAAVTLTNEGRTELWTWGSNESGALGLGSLVEASAGGGEKTDVTPTPTRVSFSPDVVPPAMVITQVECGGSHMAVIVVDPRVSSSAAAASSASSSSSPSPSLQILPCANSGAAIAPLATVLGAQNPMAAAAPPAAPASDGSDRIRLVTWGAGGCGQLGNGSFIDSVRGKGRGRREGREKEKERERERERVQMLIVILICSQT